MYMLKINFKMKSHYITFTHARVLCDRKEGERFSVCWSQRMCGLRERLTGRE